MRIKYLFLSAMAIVLSVAGMSCSKENPLDEDECLREDFKTTFKVNLSVNTSLFPYTEITVSDSISSTRGTGEWHLKYYVAAYKELSGDAYPMTMAVSDSPSVEMSLPLGKYVMVAWADYVNEGDLRSRYFHTDDFKDILLKEKFAYNGNDLQKIGFTGFMEVTVSYRTPEVNVLLKSAMGRYEIDATDKPDYKVGKIVVSYPEGLPSSFNALSGRISHKWNGVQFNAENTALNGESIFDNVFSEETETIVPIKIEVYDVNGILRARRNRIDIPMVREGITTVNAKIYSILEEGEGVGTGGAGIDDRYDDTIEINFHH